MSRPYVAAIVLTRSSGIDCENGRVRHHCQFGRTLDPCGSRARVVHLRTRWHRLEVVVVFSQPRSWRSDKLREAAATDPVARPRVSALTHHAGTVNESWRRSAPNRNYLILSYFTTLGYD